nr:MAG TPA: three-Cys-motif partner protein [Caudoviricetes sp.]
MKIVSSANNDEVISKASPHTIKKFELIEKYVETWAQKLLNNQYCDGLVFIDCMCNSGEYHDDDGKQVLGTAIRVFHVLRDAAGQYPNKQIQVYLNDINPKKIEHLKTLIDIKGKRNFHVHIGTDDGNELLKRLGQNLKPSYHYLLVYDPYDATIDWNAIFPFLNGWCEVIINHMISDSMRAVKMAKSEAAVNKYEHTYLTDINKLVPYGNDKAAYEKRIEEIIVALRRNRTRNFYIAAFPFFNSKNAIVYNLIHCTSNIAGFKLYKQTAWKAFGGKSSTKDTHGQENQLVLDFEGTGRATTRTDEYCYYINDIAKYLQDCFEGQQNVNLERIWEVLNEHPVFPSDGFKSQIKKELKQNFGAVITRESISFAAGRVKEACKR